MDKKISTKFIEGLQEKYLHSDETLEKEYASFIENKKGISSEELDDLLKAFPGIPDSLIELLKYSNGTDIYCFQSDLDGGKYPYYLIDSAKMIEEQDVARNNFSDYISRDYDEVEVDNRITNDANNAKWLLFSNCMNNGGTSQLFIDFTPSKEGKVGQIIRFEHDPDNLVVIAKSFDEYLQQIINSNYKFVDGEMEANEWLKNNPPTKTAKTKTGSAKTKTKTTTTNTKTKSNGSLTLVLIFGIISVLIGTLGIAVSHYIVGIILLLFGSVCIIFPIVKIKDRKRLEKLINKNKYMK